MDLIPFISIFPEQGESETRTITTPGHLLLPADEYAILESYCPDPECDCRRVMLNVVGRRRMQEGFLASVSFGFERDAEMAGPFLDPLNRQSRYANTLFDLVVRYALSDPAYVRRLEAHYHQVKRAAADPADPAHQVLLGLLRPHERRQVQRAARPATKQSASRSEEWRPDSALRLVSRKRRRQR